MKAQRSEKTLMMMLLCAAASPRSFSILHATPSLLSSGGFSFGFGGGVEEENYLGFAKLVP